MTPAAMKSSDLYSNPALLPDTVEGQQRPSFRSVNLFQGDHQCSSNSAASRGRMDQQFCDCRAVLLIGRLLQIELHCADYTLVKTCYDDSAYTGAHLWQNVFDPERASNIDGEGREEAHPRPRMYDGVQDLGQHVYFGIDESSSRGVGQSPLNPDLFRCIH
jgi:hypothetical protein